MCMHAGIGRAAMTPVPSKCGIMSWGGRACPLSRQKRAKRCHTEGRGHCGGCCGAGNWLDDELQVSVMGVRCGHGCCRSFSIAVCLQTRFPFAQFSYTDGGKQYDITPEKMVVRVLINKVSPCRRQPYSTRITTTV